MKQIATVVHVGDRLMAEVIRSEACEACHACKHGRQERFLIDLPPGPYAAGDRIELELPEGRTAAASLLAYGFPLIAMLTGLFLGDWLFGTDLGATLGALAMLGAALGAIKLIEPKLHHFRPHCTTN